jgi:hypothetical protein
MLSSFRRCCAAAVPVSVLCVKMFILFLLLLLPSRPRSLVLVPLGFPYPRRAACRPCHPRFFAMSRPMTDCVAEREVHDPRFKCDMPRARRRSSAPNKNVTKVLFRGKGRFEGPILDQSRMMGGSWRVTVLAAFHPRPSLRDRESGKSWYGKMKPLRTNRSPMPSSSSIPRPGCSCL